MASTGFKWLDILEKEFDKAFVDLDLCIGELESEEPDVVFSVRQKLCTLSSCFAQLTHKAQTIFQNSAKLEAELVHMRTELVESKAKRDVLQQELHNLLLQLHSVQLAHLPINSDNFLLNRKHVTHDNGIQNGATTTDATLIRQKVDAERRQSSPMGLHSRSADGRDWTDIKLSPILIESAQCRAENAQLQVENAILRNSILALNGEVYGAKLAAKYLDKELAGRIQQLQLLGREMRSDIRDRLWRQLEAEILLQRHKTVVRACRRNSSALSSVAYSESNNNTTCSSKNSQSISDNSSPDIASRVAMNGSTAQPFHQNATENDSRTNNDAFTSDIPSDINGNIRTVIVKRQLNQGLGVSITGGREHGVPILISELEPNGPAAQCAQLYIGDAILSVNDMDLRQSCHKEAVDILQKQSGDCILNVQYIGGDDSDASIEEDGYNFGFFTNEVINDMKINAEDDTSTDRMDDGLVTQTPTAPRTPELTAQSR